MRLALTVAYSAAVWCAIALLVLASFPPVLLLAVATAPFDQRLRAPTRFLWWVGRLVLSMNPMWSVDVRGREYLRPGQPYVICVNHQSYADFFALTALGRTGKFLAKRRLFLIPLLGWELFLAGFVAVRRGRRGSGQRALDRLRRYLDRGESIVVFPEGTRSETGELGAFRSGAFRLSAAARAPILPVALDGTSAILPRGSWLLRDRVRVRLAICPPIAPGEDDTPEMLRDRCRAAIAGALAELRAVHSV